MRDYAVGRGKPPIHTRFTKGNQEWRKREAKRKKRDEFSPGRDLKAVLASRVKVKRNNQVVTESRLAVIVERLISEALRGNVAAANDLLSFRLDAADVGDMCDRVMVFGPDDNGDEG